jgi:hypothetical protein
MKITDVTDEMLASFRKAVSLRIDMWNHEGELECALGCDVDEDSFDDAAVIFNTPQEAEELTPDDLISFLGLEDYEIPTSND